MADRQTFLVFSVLVYCCTVSCIISEFDQGLKFSDLDQFFSEYREPSRRRAVEGRRATEREELTKTGEDNYLPCTKGWVQHGDSCYQYNDTSVSMEEAARSCRRVKSHLVFMKDRKEMTFAADFLTGSSGDDDAALWVGARYDWRRYEWKWTRDPSDPLTGERVSGNDLDWYRNYHYAYDALRENGRICAQLNSDGDWSPVKCDQKLPFLCEKPPPCRVGWFGEDCSSRCHCSGSLPCEQEPGACPRGCMPGWTGSACDTSDPLPEATYHCLRSWDGTLQVDVQVDAKRRTFSAVQAVTQAGNPLPHCDLNVKRQGSSIFYIPLSLSNVFGADNETSADNATAAMDADESSSDNATVSVEARAAGGGEPNGLSCTAAGVDNNTVTWLLEFKQFQGVATGSDVTIEVTCDLDDVESLEPNDSVMDNSETNDRLWAARSEVVILEYLTNANTHHRVDKYHLGDTLVLHVDVLGLTDRECAVPHSCVLRSEGGGQKEIMLVDKNGCAVGGSPVTKWRSEITRSNFTTNAFPALSLGARQLNVECELDVVYEPFNIFESQCTDPCKYVRILQQRLSQ